MLRLMRDPNTPDLIRIEMAKAAAPYLHARLQAVTGLVNEALRRQIDLAHKYDKLLAPRESSYPLTA